MDRSVYVLFVYFISDISTGSSEALQDRYLGCFRNFTNQLSAVSQSMTIDLCIATCRGNNSTFAGLQGGSQCMCGENFKELVSETNCKTECSGDSSQYCGGVKGQNIAVYSVCSVGYFGIGCDRVCHCNLQAPCQRTTGACPTGCDNNWVGQACDNANASPENSNWYVGCYNDSGIRPTAMERNNPDGNTASQPNPTNFCLSVCAKYNYTYIGSQYYYDCNCGETYSRYGQSNKCNYKCEGNRNQICGGEEANSVYSTCPIGSFSLNCLSNCNCLNDARCIYNNGTCPAECKPGWTGYSCNVRDCSVANGSCDDQTEICETFDLKYAAKTRCACNEGYTRDKPWDSCRDIDECLDIVSACGIDAYNCTNTVGTFICGYCPKGLRLENGTCVQSPIVTGSYTLGIITGVFGCVCVLAVVAAVAIFCYRKKRRQTSSKPNEMRKAENHNESQMQPTNTDYENFDPKQVIRVNNEPDDLRYTGLIRSPDEELHVYLTLIPN